MQEGKVSFAYSSFLGYKKENGQIVIDEEQAEIVRDIYRMFLIQGMSTTGIVASLNERGIKTPMGKSKWTKTNVKSILTNEKYKGDALLQKTYTKNYLDHSVAKNNGEIPQYYVENSHPAIIDKEMWELVQVEIARRAEIGLSYSSTSIFSSKLICEDCGGFYGQKKWHSTASYAKFMYQCNNKYKKNNLKCKTPNFSEAQIKEKFFKAYNNFIINREEIIKDTEEVISMITDTSQLENDIIGVSNEMSIINELVRKSINDNAHREQSQDEFEKKYLELTKRHDEAEAKYNELVAKKAAKENKALRLKCFIENLKSAPAIFTDWDKELWNMMVEKAVVHRDGRITFIFYNGTKITE